MSAYPFKGLPSLTALKTFEAVARLGSAKAASDELFVTPTAISHQLKALEAQLDVLLFVRLSRQLVLTPAGEQLFEAVHMGMQWMHNGVMALQREHHSNSVILTTVPNIATRILIPFLGELPVYAPGVALRLHIAHTLSPLDGLQADVAIRYGSGLWPDVDSTLLFHNRFVVAASPSLGLKKPTDLLKLPLLHMAWPERVLPPITWSAWKQAANEHGELDEWDTEAGVVFSDETHAISAAIAGQGVALVSETVVAQELQSGLLQAPLECGLDGCGSHWVVPKSRANEAKLLAVEAWVTAACAAVMGNVA